MASDWICVQSGSRPNNASATAVLCEFGRRVNVCWVCGKSIKQSEILTWAPPQAVCCCSSVWPCREVCSLQCTHIKECICACVCLGAFMYVCLLSPYLGELLLLQPEMGSGSCDISSRLIGAVQKWTRTHPHSAPSSPLSSFLFIHSSWKRYVAPSCPTSIYFHLNSCIFASLNLLICLRRLPQQQHKKNAAELVAPPLHKEPNWCGTDVILRILSTFKVAETFTVGHKQSPHSLPPTYLPAKSPGT